MIRFRSSGGQERNITPVFVCDICDQAIVSFGGSAVAFWNHGVGEQELPELLHVHKRTCHDEAEMRLAGRGGPWHELADHLNELVMGLGLTIRGMINREVAWSDALNPTESAELEQHIEDLAEWLREHAGPSPLWE